MSTRPTLKALYNHIRESLLDHH